MGISVVHPWCGSSLHCFQVKLELGNVGFCGGRKTGVPREKPSEQGQEPTTNSTLLSTVSRLNWNLKMLVFVEGGKLEYPEKNPRSRDESQ